MKTYKTAQNVILSQIIELTGKITELKIATNLKVIKGSEVSTYLRNLG